MHNDATGHIYARLSRYIIITVPAYAVFGMCVNERFPPRFNDTADVFTPRKNNQINTPIGWRPRRDRINTAVRYVIRRIPFALLKRYTRTTRIMRRIVI